MISSSGVDAGDRDRSLSGESGAVMVMGLFLALAVLAGLGCIIGIGNAVVARDRAQEAADSTAFASAVMHARGMNFIALINLVLLAWTMLYVFLSWVDLLLSFVLVLITGIEQYQFTCVLRYATYLIDIDVNWCSIAGKLEKVEAFTFKADKRVFEGLKKVGPPLFATQAYAAMIVPHMGFFSGMEVASEYDHFGFGVSLSMIPGGGARPPLNQLTTLIDRIPAVRKKLPGGEGVAGLLKDRRIGLPVDGEAAFQLCVRGSRLVLEVAKASIGDLPINGKTLNTWTGEEPIATFFQVGFQAVGEFNHTFFCSEPDKTGGYFKRGKKPPITRVQPKSKTWWTWKDYVKEATEKLAGPMLNADRDVLRLQLKVLMFGIKGGSNDKFYLQADSFWKEPWPARVGGVKRDNEQYAGPKRVSAYAYNGSDWFQVWSLVWAGGDPDSARDVVSTPERVFGRAPAKVAEPDRQRFISQAEFYFDCDNVWQSIECNKGSAAMYQMSWRARMRRVHDINLLGDLFEVVLNTGVADAVSKKVGEPIIDKVGKRFPWMRLKDASGDAIRTDIAKIGNHRLFTGDNSSHELLH